MGENIKLMLTQVNILQLYRYVESVQAKGVVCDICTQLQDKFAIIHPSPYSLPHPLLQAQVLFVQLQAPMHHHHVV